MNSAEAFVISRLDYCNALCYGIIDERTRYLQSVQNAAAWLVMGTRRCDHISPVLRQLQWLPVRQRVMFKTAILIHRSLSGNAPGYLADDCRLVADACGSCTAFCRHSNTRYQSDAQQFCRQDLRPLPPQVWNSLLPHLRLCGLSYGQFRRLLKTFLFGQ